MLEPAEKDQSVEITVEQAEAEHPGLSPDDPRYERCPEARRPFGFLADEWVALKEKMQPGDKLVEHCTALASWQQLRGRHWIALEREGRKIAGVMCAMN